MSYFTLFYLPQKFDISLTELENNYLSLQKIYHPDKFIDKSGIEKALADKKSSEINEGYKTLKNQLSRARYLLKLQGLPIEGNASAFPAVLSRMFELEEKLLDADPDSKQLITNNCRKNVDELYSKFGKSYDQGEYETAKEVLTEILYIERILSKV